jgi:hypothetical protein
MGSLQFGHCSFASQSKGNDPVGSLRESTKPQFGHFSRAAKRKPIAIEMSTTPIPTFLPRKEIFIAAAPNKTLAIMSRKIVSDRRFSVPIYISLRLKRRKVQNCAFMFPG